MSRFDLGSIESFLRTNYHKFMKKLNPMEVLGVFEPDEVIPFIGYGSRYKTFLTKSNKKFRVKTDSVRLQVLKRSQACVTCGIVGSVFHLERVEWKDERPHFNLYAEKDGELILMTQDHIRPRAKGGRDILSNLQTMCYPCNFAKGSLFQESEDISKNG